jgi:hypothetical protein
LPGKFCQSEKSFDGCTLDQFSTPDLLLSIVSHRDFL